MSEVNRHRQLGNINIKTEVGLNKEDQVMDIKTTRILGRTILEGPLEEVAEVNLRLNQLLVSTAALPSITLWARKIQVPKKALSFLLVSLLPTSYELKVTSIRVKKSQILTSNKMIEAHLRISLSTSKNQAKQTLHHPPQLILSRTKIIILTMFKAPF